MDSLLIWCNLNSEQDALEKALGSLCVSVRGTTPSDKRIDYMHKWVSGKIPIMVSKPSVFGWGMNWQHCHNMIFVGLSDSFEQYFQAVRRCWRFGQTEKVNVYVVTASTEGAVVDNIKRKEEEFNSMLSGMIAATQEITKENIQATLRDTTVYDPQVPMVLPDWLTTQKTA